MKNLGNRARELFVRLDRFVPIVERLHGDIHPVMYDIHDLYKEIVSDKENAENKEVFRKIRQITDGYKIPDDVCESYEAVYNMLEELEKYYD